MTGLLICAVAVGVLGVVLAVAARYVAWRWLVRRRVLVVMGDRTIEGVLWARRGGLLVLRDAAILSAGQRVGVDGEMVIDRSRVEWVQVLPWQ